MRKRHVLIIGIVSMLVFTIMTAQRTKDRPSYSRLAAASFSRTPTVSQPPVKAKVIKPSQKKYAKASPMPSATSVPSPTSKNDDFVPIQKGDRGMRVKLVQQQLSNLGYLNDKVDGIFGNNTYKAVQEFQSAHNLPSDGIISAATYALLFSQSAFESYSAAQPSTSPKQTKQQNPDYRESASQGTKYVLNKSTRKFHKPSCASVKKIKPGNYKEYTGSREDVINMGYVPCKKCYP